jgi:hypothetical protein
MLFKCSNCHFQSHNLNALKSHHAKEHMQPVERKKEGTTTTINARHAPLEVILLDSDYDVSDDHSEEESSDSGEDSPASTGTNRKSNTKKQSLVKKMSAELMKKSTKKELQRLENEKSEERMRNEDKVKMIFEEAEIEEKRKKDESKKNDEYAQLIFQNQKTQRRKKKEEKNMQEEVKRENKRKEERQRAEEKRRKEEAEKMQADEEERIAEVRKKHLEEVERKNVEDERRRISAEKMEETERRKKAQENTRRLAEEVKMKKAEEERRRAQETRNKYNKELLKKMAREISKEENWKRQLVHEATLNKKKVIKLSNRREKQSKKRKAKDAAVQRDAASEDNGSEKRRREESSFICSTCHSALPDKNSFQIHLFGRHGDLWCEKCNFEGNIVTMSSHLLSVHGQVNHPSYSLMVEWNMQCNQESDENCMGSPSSSTTSSSQSLGIESVSPVKINLTPKSMLSIIDQDLVQCRQCPFKTDNLVELNRHEEEGHRQDQRQIPQSPTDSWVCPYCLVEVDTGPLLKGHIKECPDRKKEEGAGVVPQARYICPYCDIICVSKDSLKTHLFSRAKQNLKCMEKNCAFVACTPRVHSEHIKQNHWQCLQCDFNTTLQSSFGVHFLAEHSKNTEITKLTTDKSKNRSPSKKLVTPRPLLTQSSTQPNDVYQMPIIVSSTSLQPQVVVLQPQSAPPKSVVYARKSMLTPAKVLSSQNYIAPTASPQEKSSPCTSIQCPFCISTFSNSNHWFCHVATLHPTSVTTVCHLCHRNFEDAVMLKGHFGLEHKHEDIEKNSSIIVKDKQNRVAYRNGKVANANPTTNTSATDNVNANTNVIA